MFRSPNNYNKRTFLKSDKIVAYLVHKYLRKCKKNIKEIKKKPGQYKKQTSKERFKHKNHISSTYITMFC